MPLALLEAMASNIACIATNVGGIPDVIDHGINGYMIPPHDKEMLAKYMLELLESDEKRKLIADRAREKVMKEFELCLNLASLKKILLRNSLNS